jgi:hypothetical protein
MEQLVCPVKLTRFLPLYAPTGSPIQPLEDLKVKEQLSLKLINYAQSL